MKIIQKLTQRSLLKRVIWAYCIYITLLLMAFVVGYFILPEGFFRSTPITALGSIVASQQEKMMEFLATIGINLSFALVFGFGMNLQRVRGFPAGYIGLFSAGILSGLIAGSNSFVVQSISPYTLEGWIVALRVQHLELLGYAIIVASAINMGLWEYTSWIPWKSKETKIKGWKDIRFSLQEIIGFVTGIIVIIIAGYNETWTLL